MNPTEASAFAPPRAELLAPAPAAAPLRYLLGLAAGFGLGLLAIAGMMYLAFLSMLAAAAAILAAWILLAGLWRRRIRQAQRRVAFRLGLVTATSACLVLATLLLLLRQIPNEGPRQRHAAPTAGEPSLR